MSASVILLIKTVGLAVRLQVAQPELSYADAYEHASAAVEASTADIHPELLLAIAFVESRYDVTSTSRVEAGRRRTGHYESTTPPADLNRRRSLFCGPLQTYAASWRQCLAMRDPYVAYAAGAAEIEAWLRDRRVRGDITRALAGHGCGNHGVTTGKCNMYPQRVLWQERRLEAGLAPSEHVAARHEAGS